MNLYHYIILDLVFCIGVYHLLLSLFKLLNLVFHKILGNEVKEHAIADRLIAVISCLILFILILTSVYD